MFTNFANIIIGVSVSLCVGSLTSCAKKEHSAPINSTFPEPVYRFDANIDIEKAAALGKLLFFDRRLSVNGTISCADCHNPAFAFSDAGNKTSKGIHGRRGSRNVPALINLAWQQSFMWDGGINHIEWVPIASLTDSTEMGADLSDLLTWLAQDSVYTRQFATVFHSNIINTKQVLLAFTAFLTQQVSKETRYDKIQAQRENFTEIEKKGYDIFLLKCNTCHTAPLFSTNKFVSNGVIPMEGEEGRKRISQSDDDFGRFKVPTLRKVRLTFPYMHDGRFESLEQVLQHYTEVTPQLLGADSVLYNSKLLKAEVPYVLAFLATLD
jgi:cytochrome c peroxidase